MTSIQVDRRNLLQADFVTVMYFGATGDGVTDDTAAIQAAIDSGTKGILLPAGRYKVSSTITLPAHVSLFGVGPAASIIVPSTAGMTVFSYAGTIGVGFGVSSIADIQLSNFSINPGAVANVVGISFSNGNMTSVDSVWFYNLLQNVVIDQGFNHTITNCVSTADAGIKSGQIKLWSSDDTNHIFDTVVSNYRISNISNGVGSVSPAIYVRRGVSVYLSDIVQNDGGYADVFIQLENDCQGCKISRVVTAAIQTGILLQKGSGVTAYPAYCELTDCDVDAIHTVGIQMTGPCTFNTIRGGKLTFPASGKPCIKLDSTNFTIISEVMMVQYSTQNGIGVDLTATNNTFAFNNIIYNMVTGFNFNGSSNTLFHGKFNNCDTVTNGVSGTIDTGSGPTANEFVRSRAINPPFSVSTPSVPASTVAYSNTIGYPIRVFITGGTVTVIKINTVTTGLTSGSFDLECGESISITYTVVPTWIFVGR